MKHTQLKKSHYGRKAISSTTLLISLCLLSNAATAGVLSFSAVETINQDSNSSYESVSVRCDTRSTRPTLIRRANEKEWCDSVLSDQCSSDKVRIGNIVCSTSYSIALEKKQAARESITNNRKLNTKGNRRGENSVDISALREELFEIEQSLIDIKSAQLELRKKELNLVTYQN